MNYLIALSISGNNASNLRCVSTFEESCLKKVH